MDTETMDMTYIDRWMGEWIHNIDEWMDRQMNGGVMQIVNNDSYFSQTRSYKN